MVEPVYQSPHFDHLVVTTGHNHYPKLPSWATDDGANEWLRKGKERNIVHSIISENQKSMLGRLSWWSAPGGAAEILPPSAVGMLRRSNLDNPLSASCYQRWLTATLFRFIIPSLISGMDHHWRFLGWSTNMERRALPLHPSNLKTVQKLPTSKSSFSPQDTITGSLSWTRRTLITHL